MADKNRLARLLEVLCEGIYGKDHVMALSLLAAVAGEGVFLLGPPGVGKSMVARRLKMAFEGGRSFEYLMSRFSTPDEIFGPVSISALKDEGSYRRLTEGYLPSADVVFLDEIWKAGPSIQNALLTVLNEKVYLNGKEEMRLPLKLVMAASNELPAQGENLDALWDRFLVRCLVGGIEDKHQFNLMISGSSRTETVVPAELQLSEKELSVWSGGVDAVSVSDAVFAFVHVFRSKMAVANAAIVENGDKPFYVSDRRWKKLMHLWRTAAFLNGFSELHLADTLLLQDCMWDEPSQMETLEKLQIEALVETFEEQAGMPLLRERLAALREEQAAAFPVQVAFKVVRAFFYQVQSVVAGRMVLIYITEYEALKQGEPAAFVLVTDRKKTGAQLLRKYEKSRYPNVRPEDLLLVERTDAGVQVNGKSYALVQAEQDADVQVAGRGEEPDAALHAGEMSRRLLAESEEMAKKLSRWEQEETAYAKAHLFLDEARRRDLQNVFRRIRADVSSLQIDCQELNHATGKQ